MAKFLTELLAVDSASFNGDQVTFMTPTCQTDIKNVEAMNEDERATLKEAYSKVITVDAEDQPTDGRTRASSSRFALDGSWWWFTSRTVGVMRFSMSDYSFCKNDDNNFTAAKSSLPNNIARVFVHNDLVTFVYRDLKVTMKPISCLDDDEGNLLDDLEKLIRKQLKERPEEEEDEISKPEKIEEPAGR